MLFILVVIVDSVCAAGLVAGAKVTVRKKNQILEGVLKQVSPDKEPLTVITENNGKVPVWLKDVQRILLTGDVIRRGPGKTRLERGYLNVYRFETVEGAVIEGGPTVVPFFQIEDETGRQMLHLRQISLIETGEAVSAPGLTLGSRVRCKVGEKGLFGTIVGLNFPDSDAGIVVITESGENVILPLRDLMRISLVKTDTAPLTTMARTSPGAVDKRLSIHEFTTINGRTVKGRVLVAPQFTIDTGDGIRMNLWAEIMVIEKQ
jgi:hypothetical protein